MERREGRRGEEEDEVLKWMRWRKGGRERKGGISNAQTDNAQILVIGSLKQLGGRRGRGGREGSDQKGLLGCLAAPE